MGNTGKKTYCIRTKSVCTGNGLRHLYPQPPQSRRALLLPGGDTGATERAKPGATGLEAGNYRRDFHGGPSMVDLSRCSLKLGQVW